MPSGFLNIIVCVFFFFPQKVYVKMLFNLWTYILLLFSQNFFRTIHGEVYSSAAEMIEVFKLERELINIMDGFALKLQSKLDKINAYLEVSRYCILI